MQVTIVLPFFNEMGNVVSVISELNSVFSESGYDFEMIAVDDASNDGTLAELSACRDRCPLLRVFLASRRGGQSAAVFEGCRRATGSIICTMDGDGQYDPKDLLDMIKRLDEADLIIGTRTKRSDNVVKKIASRIANKIRRLVLGDRFVDVGCGLRVMRPEVLNDIPCFTGLHRFLPVLAAHNGFQVLEVPVKHRVRIYEKSKYGILDRTRMGIFDLMGVRWMIKRTVRYKLTSVTKEETS